MPVISENLEAQYGTSLNALVDQIHNRLQEHPAYTGIHVHVGLGEWQKYAERLGAAGNWQELRAFIDVANPDRPTATEFGIHPLHVGIWPELFDELLAPAELVVVRAIKPSAEDGCVRIRLFIRYPAPGIGTKVFDDIGRLLGYISNVTEREITVARGDPNSPAVESRELR